MDTMELKNHLSVLCEAFTNEGTIPIAYTGRGEDISPGFRLSPIIPDTKSIAIIMDDIDHPLFGIYNHWVIWNIPAQEYIPGRIPQGETVDSLGGAVQGRAYGKHKYRGPKPPFGTHRYQFHFYALDCVLDLKSHAGKKELIQSMEGHILQYGSIIGKFQ
ncbi:YbhB/YbcL family Raf kinase inhibitor-like protein [Oscillospiraceae bacterium PP1C4]